MYLIEYGYKRPITSKSALLSRFNSDLIIPVNSEILTAYPVGRPISFPNYSLLKDDDGHIYLLVDDALRQIDSMTTFRSIGFNEDEVQSITNDDLALYDIGTTLRAQPSTHKAHCFSSKQPAQCFYIRDGERHAIFDKTIMTANFSGMPITPVDSVVIEQFKEGKPVKLPDGWLVKFADDPTVFVISEGKRRPIDSEQTFLAFGWSWGDIVTVNQDALNTHPLGEAITQGEE